MAEDFAETDAFDAELLAAAQAIESYEISRYGTLKTWAQQLDFENAVQFLMQRWAKRRRALICSPSSQRRGSTSRPHDSRSEYQGERHTVGSRRPILAPTISATWWLRLRCATSGSRNVVMDAPLPGSSEALPCGISIFADLMSNS
jgi:Domain of unknown function (DUF892)